MIDNLEFSPFRLRVLGTAGSGKSQLTMRFYQQALNDGKRVLLLCFNRPLADRLQTIAGEYESVDSFHGFCARIAERAGIDLDAILQSAKPRYCDRATTDHYGVRWLFCVVSSRTCYVQGRSPA